MLSVISPPVVAGGGHPGLVHSLVARMEERLGMRADARADELSERQRRLESTVDRLVMLYLLHTPEVAPQLHRGAGRERQRRYGGYWQAVDDLLAAKRRGVADEERPETTGAEAS